MYTAYFPTPQQAMDFVKQLREAGIADSEMSIQLREAEPKPQEHVTEDIGKGALGGAAAGAVLGVVATAATIATAGAALPAIAGLTALGAGVGAAAGAANDLPETLTPNPTFDPMHSSVSLSKSALDYDIFLKTARNFQGVTVQN